MIDNFSLGLTHVLMLYVAWRLFARTDLDTESAQDAPKTGWGRKAGRK